MAQTWGSSSSSSSSSHHNHDRSRPPPRHQSPPASAYFPLLAPDHLRPTQDAESHFSYSTTLRRHPVDVLEEASGIWDQVTSNYRRHTENVRSGAPQSRGPQTQESRDTLSARFAHTSIQDTIAYYHTQVQSGLSSNVVSSLLLRYGYNEFHVSSPEPLYIKFFKTIYESPLILLLVASATISAIMGNVDDAVSITVAVAIVVTVGFVQERRSEKSLEALNKLVPHHCHVLRDSQTLHILANELVPGDIVQLSTGDRVPADIRLVEAFDLEIDESSLTGETEARRKSDQVCIAEQGTGGPVPLAERHCIAYMGTLVRNGRGTGVVIATGTETEFGVIFSMMQEVEEKRTPLQLSMDELAQKLSMASFGVIGIICLIGLWQNRSWLEMFTIGVSLAVAAIPEGLPIVTTVTLALGVLRMAKRKAIVKKLHSVESLGSVSVVCSDKTGTLTKNEMTVVEVYAVDETVQIDPSTSTPTYVHSKHLNPIANSGSHFNPSSHTHSNSLSGIPSGLSPALKKTLEVGALCNNAQAGRGEDGRFMGQSTEVALLEALNVWNLNDPRQAFKRLAERPFNSEQKYMAVSGVHTSTSSSQNQREMYYVKGALSAILDRCKYYYVSGDSTPVMDAAARNLITTKAHSAASRGLRVIGMAYGQGSAASGDSTPNGTTTTTSSRASTPSGDKNLSDEAKNNLVFVGFEAMLDPPRKGVADSIALLQSGGVQVVMITGDAEDTALSIARTLGLRVPTEHESSKSAQGGQGQGIGNFVLTGKMIDQMSRSELRERVGTVSVFARTTPRHKMAIVEAYQSLGKIVAMTGDGVNDAPALKMADIGVSMGKSGTDVAKEAADVILVDDNFSTILPAVEEGKSIFHNIQNFLAFQLSTAAAALSLITLSTMFGLSNPLNAMQILFINILMDGPPSQSLGVDPVDPAVMRKPPRKKDAPIITQQLLMRVMFSASIIVMGTLFVYLFALSDDNMSRREQTMTFTCFVFLDLVSAVQNRGLGCGLTQNRMLVTTVSISFFTQLALVYVPVMQAIFQTEALRMNDLGVLLGLAGTSFLLHEGRRTYERKKMADSNWATVVQELV